MLSGLLLLSLLAASPAPAGALTLNVPGVQCVGCSKQRGQFLDAHLAWWLRQHGARVVTAAELAQGGRPPAREGCVEVGEGCGAEAADAVLVGMLRIGEEGAVGVLELRSAQGELLARETVAGAREHALLDGLAQAAERLVRRAESRLGVQSARPWVSRTAWKFVAVTAAAGLAGAGGLLQYGVHRKHERLGEPLVPADEAWRLSTQGVREQQLAAVLLGTGAAALAAAAWLHLTEPATPPPLQVGVAPAGGGMNLLLGGVWP